ncbi:WD40-repeat-containing domain protein [Polychytrium aggregatum]|uniref:WD40-repeat-containing domain protein n=1 Tax=Polychytrium aggregatum TaxID=110093 RepID=UPI0022FDEE26|nr:WD40-repeat-containing domain protein [Polychytrium aggregatum]KAI9199241.1 WD40-repeat-containing domain protein [Polychytrium aggregatum]
MEQTPFQLIRKYPKTQGDYAMSLTASVDQTLIASGWSSNLVTVYDRSSLSEIFEFQTAPSTDAPLSEIKFDTTNSSLLWIGSKGGLIQLWDLRSRAAPALTLQAGAPVLSFDINASHTLLSAGTELQSYEGLEEDEPVGDAAKLCFWDVRTQNALVAFNEVHSDDITQVRFHPTHGEALMTGSTDGLINLYNLATLVEDDSLYQTLKVDSVSKLGYFGPSYEYLYCSTHIETFSLWNFQEAEVISSYGDIRSLSTPLHKIDYIIDCHYDHESQRLFMFTGSQEGSIGISDVSLQSASIVHTLNNGHSDIVRDVLWNKNTRTIVSGGEDATVCFWSN